MTGVLCCLMGSKDSHSQTLTLSFGRIKNKRKQNKNRAQSKRHTKLILPGTTLNTAEEAGAVPFH